MEGHITHTAITSYGYGTLRLKKGPNLPGPIFPTLHIISYIFLLNNYSLRDPIYIRPPIFLFSRPTLATHFRDSLSRLPFATPFRNPHSRLTFTTPFSRLTFATTLATHVRDSRSRPTPRFAIFLSRLPSCNSTTDGRTVLTPQRHLPSVPTLTLL